MRKYDRMTDEQLIDELRSGDQGVTDYIMDKYKSMVRKKAHAMFLLGGENEDLIQEGMIGLIKAEWEILSQALQTCAFHARCIVRSRRQSGKNICL